MAYKFKGKEAAAHDDEAHIMAKFAYFRAAEARIDAGPGQAPMDYQPAPIRARGQVAECGTHSGWARHGREGSSPCRPCLDARASYQRQYRSRRAAA